MAKTFTAQIEAFRDLTLKNMKFVASQAIQDVVIAAQTPQDGIGRGATTFEEGKIPVVTSELINSLTSEGIVGAESYAVVIAEMEIGDTLQFAWTSDHAMPMEAGFTTQSGTQVLGRHFVGANAERFSEFVAARVAEVKK